MNSQHVGSCRLLFMSLKQRLSEEMCSSISKHSGTDDECFRNIIDDLAEKAINEIGFPSLEYAKICQQVAEFFDPVSDDSSKKVNKFTHQLRNAVQTKFTEMRKNKFIYKSRKEHKDLEAKVKPEKNIAAQSMAQKILNLEFEVQMKTKTEAIGVVKFIAELFNVEILNCRVMYLCIKHILSDTQQPTELDIECFHVLYTIAGKKLEMTAKGEEIVDQALTRLEEIADKFSESFCEEIRILIVDVFELRANIWNFHELSSNGQPKTEVDHNQNEILDTNKKSDDLSAFLKGVNVLMHKLNHENLSYCIVEFLEKAFNKERLEGAVLLIFERALESPETASCFALFSKGVADIVICLGAEDCQTETTFTKALLGLCSREIIAQHQNYSLFEGIDESIEALKYKNKGSGFDEARAAIGMSLKMHNRACRFAEVYAELFNYNIVESRLIFVYLAILSSPKNITNTSIECFCVLVKRAGVKLAETNIDALEENILRMQKASTSIKLSARSKDLIKNLLLSARYKLKIAIDFEDEFVVFHKRESEVKASYSFKPLWNQATQAEPNVIAPTKQLFFNLIQRDSNNEQAEFPNEAYAEIYNRLMHKVTNFNFD